ncbi:MAG TPA: hypothetical protein DIW47_07505 [Bacteroidetes bacterium]|nr:hypothetical protein [Bacteroidota bacterium]
MEKIIAMKKTFFYGLMAIVLFSCSEDFQSADTMSSGSNETGSSGKGGSMARFAISGTTLYTVSHQTLNAFDISVPSKPVFMSQSYVGTDIETIFPKGNYLFIGAESGMYIFDVTDRNKPVQMSKYLHVVSCDPVVADGNYAYVTLRSAVSGRCWRGANELQILDISNPANPQKIRSYPMSSPAGLGIDANLNLFVCDQGLKHYDATDVMSLQIINHFKGINPFDVIPIGNRLLLIGSDGFYQYLLDNGTLTLLSKIPIG